ncbi:hypothetical protein [Lentzea albidocapillata]|uniref:hypothetical protein n=1 Tax=Lentzea albidocapillata TaxID=40571 RepID=UPI000ACBB2B5|nr:hypothetical protein [Lentzea albidocapillata]
MDLTSWLLRRTPVRPLIAAMPGGTWARVAVEQFVRQNGWRLALSPAEANVLVVAGPTTAEISPYVDQVWSSIPAPRVRVHVMDGTDAERALSSVASTLHDVELQRGEAQLALRKEGLPQSRHDQHSSAHSCGAAMHDDHASEMSCGGAMADEHGGHEDHGEHEEHGGHQHGGREEHGGSHQHGGHHGHDMSSMELPGGLSMADRGADRDGLTLDQLHVPLGPVLPDWPEGLVVHTVLQGDVIQQAHVEVIGASPAAHDRLPLVARRLDSAARLLSVAGWADAAAQARVLRDEALTERSNANDLNRWARRVRRSRLLRWSLRGIGGALPRLHHWLDDIVAGRDTAGEPAAHELAALLTGAEFAAARLIVASVDPATHEVTHHA